MLLVSKATQSLDTLGRLVDFVVQVRHCKLGLFSRRNKHRLPLRKGLEGWKDVPDTTNMVIPPPFTPKILNGQIPLSVVGVDHHARHLPLNVDETRMFQVWAPHQVNK
jgi:hypothetical protein